MNIAEKSDTIFDFYNSLVERANANESIKGLWKVINDSIENGIDLLIDSEKDKIELLSDKVIGIYKFKLKKKAALLYLADPERVNTVPVEGIKHFFNTSHYFVLREGYKLNTFWQPTIYGTNNGEDFYFFTQIELLNNDCILIQEFSKL